MKTEHDEQKAVVNCLRDNFPKLIIAAVPNGEQRSRMTGVKLKAEGVLAGMPDIVITMPKGKVIWLEMKTEKGKLSEVQIAIHKKMKKLGHTVIVGYSAKDAITKLVDFLT